MVVAPACRSGSDADPQPSEATTIVTPATTSTTRPTTQTTTAPVPAVLIYKVAILGDVLTDNPWSALDAEDDEWTRYVLEPTIPTLYRLRFPGSTLTPWMAADVEPPIGAADAERWVIDVNMQDGLVWSDGSPLTANDVAFTFNTVASLGLAGSFLEFYPIAAEDNPDSAEDESAHGLIAVEALSDTTVRFTWSSQPGLGEWQFGAAQGPIFSEAFWGPHVSEASGAAELYAVSGVGAPSGGPMVFDSRVPGQSVRLIANTRANGAGATNVAYDSGGFGSSGGGLEYEVGDTSGDVVASWTEGPQAAEVIYFVYETQDAAVQALVEGEVDIVLDSGGLQLGSQRIVHAASDLNVITNTSQRFRYLAFNTRRFPGSNPAFRQAMACMIDSEFIATEVLQGAAIAVNTVVPSGNTFWANPSIVAWCDGQTRQERVRSAIQILRDDGWTWTTEPEWNEVNIDVLPQGAGLRGPNGETLSALELLVPGQGFDPLRATYGLFIEEWANDLGIPLAAELTGFSFIVDSVFGPTDWDMYILGWGTTTYPDYVVEWFETAADSASGGFNIPGYSNLDFDVLAAQFRTESDLAAAAALVRKMDAIIARDVPYVMLFTPATVEAYRNTLEFPATTLLGGLQNFGGLAGTVKFSE